MHLQIVGKCVLSLAQVFVKKNYKKLWLQNRILGLKNTLLIS